MKRKWHDLVNCVSPMPAGSHVRKLRMFYWYTTYPLAHFKNFKVHRKLQIVQDFLRKIKVCIISVKYYGKCWKAGQVIYAHNKEKWPYNGSLRKETCSISKQFCCCNLTLRNCMAFFHCFFTRCQLFVSCLPVFLQCIHAGTPKQQ